MKEQSTILSKSILKEYNYTKSFFRRKYLCRAPFSAMRFDFKGNVYTCCYNHSYKLGSYPDQKIMEIWKGNIRKELEKAILKKDLNTGCEICKKQLENKEFYAVKARIYDHLKIKNKYPSLLEFELDSTCNLECIMCNGQASSMIRINREKKKPYQNLYDNNFLNQLEPFLHHISHANFIGGEPFLISMYYDIWNKIISVNKNVRINLSTNGTILNDNIKNILEKGKFDISVSIDSIVKETFEKIRIQANYDIVFTNLEYFNNYCLRKNTGFNVWVCPIVTNAFEIPELVRYFTEKNITVYFNTVTLPHSVSIQYLKHNEIHEIYNFYNSNKIIAKHDNYKRLNDLVKQIKLWEDTAFNREVNDKNFEGFDSKKLQSLYFAKSLSLIDNMDNSNDKKIKLNNKINEIILGKDEQTMIKIFKFILSLPVKESTDIIFNISTESIDDYIRQNF